MTEPVLAAPREVAELLGDPHPMAEQLGSSTGLAALPFGTTLARNRVTDSPSLRRFLLAYHSEILLPVELPAIRRAHGHVSRYELRELIQLDVGLLREERMRDFSAASRAVGRSQLRRLLPMRDQRLVRRYWEAVEAGDAPAWHVLVYGMILGLFSLPIRQGLVSYALRTTRGFVLSASRPLALTQAESEGIVQDCTERLPDRINEALGGTEPQLLVG